MKKSLVFLVLAVLVLTMSSCLIQPKCKKPQASAYGDGTVSLGSQTYGAEIYFTYREGGDPPSDPHSGSNLFRRGDKINMEGLDFPIIIKAQAVKEGYRNSGIATIRYSSREDVFFGETNYPDTLNIPLVDTLVTGEPL